ncbi:hypothetical protein SNE40_022049 [Patella caerulea]|uniref:Uncharacterized protein n=1 Tax=Patella caerulea TaxID=87958 RepID=A0AAN8GCE7_PATCE
MEYKVKEYVPTNRNKLPRAKEYQNKDYTTKVEDYKPRDPPVLPLEYKTADRMETKPVASTYNEYVPPWTRFKNKFTKKNKTTKIVEKMKPDKTSPILPGVSTVGSVKRMLDTFSTGSRL